jgi:hypothetical protein
MGLALFCRYHPEMGRTTYVVGAEAPGTVVYRAFPAATYTGTPVVVDRERRGFGGEGLFAASWTSRFLAELKGH